MKANSLLDHVRSFLRAEKLAGGRIVVAVSGGPDSVALLHALAHLLPRQDLFAAHLNHQLRGADSDGDEAFVIELGARLGVPVRTTQIPMAVEAMGDNLESAARRLRYDWLLATAAECQATIIATGHTADDQAETVLHHMIRGTGLRGLRGVARRRKLTDRVEVIRPLLEVRRSEVEDYLQAEGIAARIDATNRNEELTRNRIRHRLLPMLAAEFNPGIVENLCRMAEHAQEFHARLQAEAAALLAEAERPRAGDTIILLVPALQSARRHWVRETLHLVWEREGWPLGRMDFASWDRLAELIFGAETALDLTDGVQARRKGIVLQLRRG